MSVANPTVLTFPRDGVGQSLRDAVAWTNLALAGGFGAGQLLQRGHGGMAVFPVSWDANSPERRLADVLAPFVEMGGAVESVLRERKKLLGERRALSNGPAGGRLLAYEPTFTLGDGVSQYNSDGFFDISDCPPMDCWVAYIVNESAVAKNLKDPMIGVGEIDTLISYVPSYWLAAADRGVWSNPCACLRWLDEEFLESRPALRFLRDELGVALYGRL